MASETYWTDDNRRTDRPEFSVDAAMSGWVIKRGDAVIMSECPCCDLPFREARHAKMACETLYPPLREE
jgi:hypothetical protein